MQIYSSCEPVPLSLHKFEVETDIENASGLDFLNQTICSTATSTFTYNLSEISRSLDHSWQCPHACFRASHCYLLRGSSTGRERQKKNQR